MSRKTKAEAVDAVEKLARAVVDYADTTSNCQVCGQGDNADTPHEPGCPVPLARDLLEVWGRL